MTPMRMPIKYHVIEKVKNNGYTKLQLQKVTDRADTFWWQISSSKQGIGIHCTFDTSPPTPYYKYWGNILIGNTEIIADAMGLSTLEQNETINFNDLDSIPKILQDILEYV